MLILVVLSILKSTHRWQCGFFYCVFINWYCEETLQGSNMYLQLACPKQQLHNSDTVTFKCGNTHFFRFTCRHSGWLLFYFFCPFVLRAKIWGTSKMASPNTITFPQHPTSLAIWNIMSKSRKYAIPIISTTDNFSRGFPWKRMNTHLNWAWQYGTRIRAISKTFLEAARKHYFGLNISCQAGATSCDLDETIGENGLLKERHLS